MVLHKRKAVLSIDLGSSEIKVVEGKFNKKEIIIYNSFSIDIPEGIYYDGNIIDIHKMGLVLKDNIEKNKISTEKVNLVINSSSIITRQISIPKLPKEEIESILNYQVEDYMPINIHEYIIQYIILDEIIDNRVEKLNLLLVGVPKNMIESHLKLLNNIDLRPNVLDFQGNSITKLIFYNSIINDIYSLNNKTLACIDVGNSSTKLTLIKDGNMHMTRVLNIGTANIIKDIQKNLGIAEKESEEMFLNMSTIGTESYLKYKDSEIQSIIDKNMQLILSNIDMVFRYFRSRNEEDKIDLIFIQGGMANFNGIESLFSSQFKIPAIKLNSLNKISFKYDLSRYSNAIGGLIRRDEVWQ